jgi:Na+-translocating ferredoxin:NAD+ oxidoreductase RnfC subunit
MLTQLVRYGHMLKVELKSARCRVKATWQSYGSVFAGTIGSKCLGVEARLEVESDDDPARVAALIQNAEGGCYAQSAIVNPVPFTSRVALNGDAFDYKSFPSRVSRRTGDS